jgi:hypothetical protein
MPVKETYYYDLVRVLRLYTRSSDGFADPIRHAVIFYHPYISLHAFTERHWQSILCTNGRSVNQLGVSADASDSDLKKAYRKQAIMVGFSSYSVYM